MRHGETVSLPKSGQVRKERKPDAHMLAEASQGASLEGFPGDAHGKSLWSLIKHDIKAAQGPVKVSSMFYIRAA